jgi:formylmethanofuran dehydrogenase subunit A
MISRINRTARRRLDLPNIDREYTLGEIATITRAAPAKSLTLMNKGHLGLGADADIAIYDLDPSKVDLEKKPYLIRKSFKETLYTIKNGKIVSKQGQIAGNSYGNTFYAESQVSKNLEVDLIKDIQSRFKDYYTIEFENYPISDSFLRNPAKTSCEAEI